MRQALYTIVEQSQRYFGKSLIFVFFIVSIIYILFKKERRELIFPTAILSIIIFNPLLYIYIWDKFLSSTYWRMIWLIPLIPITAYAFVLLCNSCKSCLLKFCIFLTMAFIILISGDNVYKNGSFEKADNMYKIPQEVIDVADMLNALGIDSKVIAPENLYTCIRQYDTNIKLAYGRNAEGFIDNINGDEKIISQEMKKTEPDFAKMTKLARKNNYKYIVYNEADKSCESSFEACGYQKLEQIGTYSVYKDIWIQIPNVQVSVEYNSNNGQK